MSPQERQEFDTNVLMRRQILEEKIRQYNTQHHGQETDEFDSVWVKLLPFGVIGNTTDSGLVILGSSPGGAAI